MPVEIFFNQFSGGGGPGGSSFSAGVSTQGNTLGTTGTNAAGLVLVGGTNITLSQSSAVGGATVSIIGGGGGGVIATDVKGVGGLSSVGTITRFSPEDHIHVGVAGIKPSATASTFVGNLVLSAGNLMSLASGGNSTAGTLTFANLLSSSVQAQPVSNVSSAGTNASRFALADHAHLGVAGIVPNATASSFVGYVNLSAGAGMSLVSGGNSSAGSLQLVNLFSSATHIQEVSSATAAGAMVSRFANEDHVHAGVGPAGISNIGNTQGNTGALFGRVVFAGGANITLSGSSSNNNAQTITIVGGAGGAFSGGVSDSGNTAGTTGTVNNGILLVGGSNITLSQSSAAGGATVSIIGASGGAGAAITLLSYEPYGHVPQAANTGVTATMLLASGTSSPVVLFPMVIEEYIKAEYMNLLVTHNFVTIAANSGRQTAGVSYGFYTRQTGASSTVLSILMSNALNWSVTGNNSSYSINHPTQTDTAGFTNAETNSAGSNITSQFTGVKLLVLPVSSIISPGVYWLGLVHTYSTNSSSVGVVQNIYGFANAALINQAAPFGQLSSAYTAGSKAMDQSGGPWILGLGSWSTANNAALPNSIGLQSITAGGAIAMLPYVNFWAKA